MNPLKPKTQNIDIQEGATRFCFLPPFNFLRPSKTSKTSKFLKLLKTSNSLKLSGSRSARSARPVRPVRSKFGVGAGVGGWTFIELLVVMVLLGVLLVISIQALADSRESTRDAAANSMVRTLNQAHSRAYLANESQFLNAAVSFPRPPGDPPVLFSGIPGAQLPANDLDVVYWYLIKGLLLPTQVNTNVLGRVERAPSFDSDGSLTGIWRRAP